jgi:predicted Zn-dependent peptidase
MENGLSWSREVLSNGLTVLQYPRPSALTAQLSVAIKYGSNEDPDEAAGKAHFLEHMIVGGSKTRIRLHHEIEKIGGCSGFETSAECTFATLNVFPDKIAEASRILAGLLFDSEFESDKVELERKVIFNEIAEAADSPHDKIAETLIKCLFKKHPIRNPVLGTNKTVKQLTIKDLKSAHNRYYTPKNMIVILTGKFSKKDLKAVLFDFQSKKNQDLPQRREPEIEEGKPKKQAKLTRSGINQAYLCFGLRTPPAKDLDAVTLDLINAVLGLGESSRLFVELREKRALTYDFNSMNISGLDHGFFTIACAVQPKHLQQALNIITGELWKITNTLVTADELEKSKNVVVGDIMRAMDSTHELPRLITDTEIVYGNQEGLSGYVTKLKKLTSQDILATASKYFKEENYSTVTLTPK